MAEVKTERVLLTAETIVGGDGATLNGEISEALRRAGDWHEDHIERTGGSLADKPVQITATITVGADGMYSREVEFAVAIKFPDGARKRTVPGVTSRNGMLLLGAQQMRLPVSDSSVGNAGGQAHCQQGWQCHEGEESRMTETDATSRVPTQGMEAETDGTEGEDQV